METAIAAVEANIKSAKSMVDYYQKEIDTNTKRKEEQIKQVEKLEADYEALRKALNI